MSYAPIATPVSLPYRQQKFLIDVERLAILLRDSFQFRMDCFEQAVKLGRHRGGYSGAKHSFRESGDKSIKEIAHPQPCKARGSRGEVDLRNRLRLIHQAGLGVKLSFAPGDVGEVFYRKRNLESLSLIA